MKKQISLYLEESLVQAVDRVCRRLQCDAGLPESKPNRSALVTRVLEEWLEGHGEEVPGREDDGG